MLYPLTFRPIFKERVWGGRNLERLYAKALPPRVLIGESWEVSDRPDNVSIIANGALAGKSLHWIVEHYAEALLGEAKLQNGRFPLLIKLLDAQEKLSLQVHPPLHKATELGGEPKTEMWYIADAAPGAELFVGLKRGVTPAEFERKVRDESVADCFHHVSVRAGDAMFLPSGRVHAIGAGLVIFEIQQNSDTTYRVFDWNRVGLDRKPRELHVAQSLASIDFEDFEPSLIASTFVGDFSERRAALVRDTLFTVELVKMATAVNSALKPKTMQIIGCLEGKPRIETSVTDVELAPGEFCLVPACLNEVRLRALGAVKFLRIEAG